ncbi:hypothetical protein LEP1GSC127_0977 [Leptospira kirschneri str. 200801925]|nr:hypothetical protein LEP1GSC127_0977 [Leptospira kirschneri str. 200801925]
MIQKLKADQKEFFESLPKEIQESLQSSLSKIDRVNFIKSTSKIFKKLKNIGKLLFQKSLRFFSNGAEKHKPHLTVTPMPEVTNNLKQSEKVHLYLKVNF